jgi:hypothetical protein
VPNNKLVPAAAIAAWVMAIMGKEQNAIFLEIALIQ